MCRVCKIQCAGLHCIKLWRYPGHGDYGDIALIGTNSIHFRQQLSCYITPARHRSLGGHRYPEHSTLCREQVMLVWRVFTAPGKIIRRRMLLLGCLTLENQSAQTRSLIRTSYGRDWRRYSIKLPRNITQRSELGFIIKFSSSFPFGRKNIETWKNR